MEKHLDGTWEEFEAWQPVVKVILARSKSFAWDSSSRILDKSTDLSAFRSSIPNKILRSPRRSTFTTDCWMRETIGSDFRRRIRPQDTRSNRKMVADLILGDIERNDGVFPDSNAFVERT